MEKHIKIPKGTNHRFAFVDLEDYIFLSFFFFSLIFLVPFVYHANINRFALYLVHFYSMEMKVIVFIVFLLILSFSFRCS